VKRILLSSLLFLFCFILIGAGKKEDDLIQRTIRYGFTLQNTTNHVLRETKFYTYGPVKENSIQKVIEIKASLPYELNVDNKGNQVLCFIVSDLPPYATKVIEIEAKLSLLNTPKHAKVKNLKEYIKSEKYIESGDPEISQLAKELKNSIVLKTAESIFKWVLGNIKDIGYIEQDRGAFYAFKNKTGDCTEQAYLFVALCRANSIPARVIGGYVSNKDKILKPEAYHNWAEFYDNGK